LRGPGDGHHRRASARRATQGPRRRRSSGSSAALLAAASTAAASGLGAALLLATNVSEAFERGFARDAHEQSVEVTVEQPLGELEDRVGSLRIDVHDAVARMQEVSPGAAVPQRRGQVDLTGELYDHVLAEHGDLGG